MGRLVVTQCYLLADADGVNGDTDPPRLGSRESGE
jgi:hypothetical protein